MSGAYPSLLRFAFIFTFKIVLLIAYPAAYAQDGDVAYVLAQLPFGIQIGRTHVKDIAHRGNCIKQKGPVRAKLTGPLALFAAAQTAGEENINCSRFDMAGRFEVFLADSGFVNKVVFANHQGHVLPREWRAAGLSVGVEGKQPGTSFNAFKQLVSGAKNLRISTESDDDISLSFEIGRNAYEAKFWKRDSSEQPDRDADTWVWRSGLFRLEILEGY